MDDIHLSLFNESQSIETIKTNIGLTKREIKKVENEIKSNNSKNLLYQLKYLKDVEKVLVANYHIKQLNSSIRHKACEACENEKQHLLAYYDGIYQKHANNIIKS